MKKIIIENQENCALVDDRFVINGHDCWGVSEGYTERFVMINKERKVVFSDMYVIHDGKKALDTGYISHLPDRIRVFLDEDLEKKLKKERYEEYLLLKKEFENEKK